MEYYNKDSTYFLNYNRYILFIILFSIIIRISLMLIFQSWDFNDKETYGHRAGEIASSIASGGGYSWPEHSSYVPDDAIKKTSWEAPVYPFIIALSFKFFGIYTKLSAIILILFQVILSALCCYLIFLVGQHYFGNLCGLIGAFIFAIYPVGIHYCIQKIQTSVLIATLLLLFILQINKLLKSYTLKKAFLCGLTFGVSILTDPTLIIFLAISLLFYFFNNHLGLKSRSISILIILLTAFVVNLPWQIRNYIVFGDLFLSKSNFSRELFMGNFGNSHEVQIEFDSMATIDEGERNKEYLRKAQYAIIKNPFIFIKKTYERIYRYWLSTKCINQNRINLKYDIFIVSISYYFILLSFLIGLYFSIRRKINIRLLLMAVLLLPIPYYITWFERYRYRFPVEVVMIFFSSYFIYCVFQKYFKKKLVNALEGEKASV